MHPIPTYPGSKPYRAKDPIYSGDEIRWQTEMLPAMTGVVVNPAPKTTWAGKKEGPGNQPTMALANGSYLFCSLNSATIKTNYPMKRVELILEELSREDRRFF